MSLPCVDAAAFGVAYLVLVLLEIVHVFEMYSVV